MKLLDRFSFKTRFELLLLPTILFIFLVNMHFFQWYRDHYSRSTAYMKNISIKDRYERIQSQHPYYEIYQLSQKYKNRENKIHFVFYFQGDQNIDYATTYYLNPKNTPADKIKNYYMNELRLFLDYFFYPYIINPINPDQLTTANLKVDDVIVSDVDLYNLPKLNPKTLNLLRSIDKSGQIVKHKEPLIPNRRPEDTYFLYTIKGFK